MFIKEEIAYLVDLQTRSYELLKWVAAALGKGFISFHAAHAYTSMAGAAEEWLERNYQNIPERARVPRENIKEFAALFSTYLENSFELIAKPKQRLYSPDAHCFCPMCSWLVDAPNLKPRALSTANKKRAQKMMLDEVRRLAVEQDKSLSDRSAQSIIKEENLREALALCAYGADLVRRTHGTAVGPAALVLWRSFAWLPSGSPKKNFKLSAEMILQAEQTLAQRIAAEKSGA